MAVLFACRFPLVLLALAAYRSEGQFLAPSPDLVSRARVVEQLQSLLGHDRDLQRLGQVEDILRPTFLSLPKNQLGGLDHPAARHALYRYFLVQHSWYVRGLAREMDEGSSSSADVLRKSQMPTFIIELLEERVKHRGIGLKELAVLAATIEDLVRSEGVDMLMLAYSGHGMSPSDALDEQMQDFVMKTFLMYLLLPNLQQKLQKPADVMRYLGRMPRLYPGWDDAVLWVDDLREALMRQDRSSTHPFAPRVGRTADFKFVAQLATQIKAEWGRFADQECKMMRNKLIDLEDVEREDGRVRLSQFYRPYVDGVSFHFSESPEYLKHLGALDDHHPQGASVVVPNLIYAQSNCVSVSGFHSVCCIDDCEVLISALEEKVVGPTAPPAEVAEAVAAIPSETVAAPRNLSAPLLQRLDAIATRHGGRIPLHSRLFAEWLHFAFPNECPYPRSLLTSEAQLSPQEWSKHAQRKSKATPEEMAAASNAFARRTEGPEFGADGPTHFWSEDEELLGELAPASAVTLSSTLRLAATIGIFLSTAFGLASTYRAGRLGSKSGTWALISCGDPASATHFV